MAMTTEGFAVPKFSTGNRKIVKGVRKALLACERAEGLKPDEKPYSIIVAVRGAKAALGLSSNALTLANVLFSWTTQAVDFLPGNRAIVWRSNKDIMDACGWTDKKTYTRAARELQTESLIYFRDSENGTRRGRRNKETGAVVVADTFGIDLTPMCAYRDELVAKAQKHKKQQAYKRRIKESFIQARKRAEELFSYAGTLLEYHLLAPTLERIERLKARYAETGKDFKAKIQLTNSLEWTNSELLRMIEEQEAANEAADHAAEDTEYEGIISYLEQTDPQGGQMDPSIIPITGTPSILSNGLSDKKVAEPEGTERAKGSISRQWDKIKQIREAAGAEPRHKMSAKPSFKQVRASLPFKLRTQIRDDHGYYQLYDLINDNAGLHGLKPRMVSYTRSQLGLELTCAALSILINKRNEIRSPEAYMNSIIKSHEKGAFRAAASLFGIIDRRLKDAASPQLDMSLG